MSVINKIFLLFSSELLKTLEAGRKNPRLLQNRVFDDLLKGGNQTVFGKEHCFDKIRSVEDFQKYVPVREYDDFQPYIMRIRNGEDYVLWNEKTTFFAKSSGTSSDKSKYIPITKANLLGCHYRGMRMMLTNYVHLFPDSRLFTGKSLTLGGSVAADINEHHFSGDLSAILLKNSPKLAEFVRTPSKGTAMLDDFNEKVERICKECSNEDVTSFSGVPSWNLIMIRKILEYNNTPYLTDVWPNIELFMHGGINFEPYRKQFEAVIRDKKVRFFENYNASEGYFAFQDDPCDDSMLLTLDNGVFYEFIPIEDIDNNHYREAGYKALCIDEVRTGEHYAIVISTNAGLWRYLIGDVVEFTSLYPHKIVISGRVKLFINAFGEELMIGNAEKALADTCRNNDATVADYTVAPVYMDSEHSGAHEWVIEFEQEPANLKKFAKDLDTALCQVNSDYDAKRNHTGTMEMLHLSVAPSGTFYKWMKSRGKIGGQNKVPRLSNERKYVEQLKELIPATKHKSEKRTVKVKPEVTTKTEIKAEPVVEETENKAEKKSTGEFTGELF